MGEVENQRLMIVGSGSFLALHYLRYSMFRKSNRIMVVGRDHRPDHEGVESAVVEEGDIEGLKNIIREFQPTHLLNFAGVTSGSAETQVYVNTTIPCSILDSVATNCPDCQVVLIGSAAEYGIPTTESISESHPLNPISFYGLTKKWQTEAAVLFKHRGISVSIARVFNLLGPGLKNHLAFGSFVSQIKLSEDETVRLKTGNLDVYRDFLDIRDAVRAIDLLLGAKEKSSMVYNLCSGRAENLARLLADLIEFSGRNVVVEKDSSRLRANDVETISGCYAKLEGDTGWGPEYSASEALEFMWNES